MFSPHLNLGCGVFLCFDGDGNIVRSLDISGSKEYNYVYEEGRITRSTEADIVLSGELVTAKTIVNSIRYYYDGEGKLKRKTVTSADGTARSVFYETKDDNTVVYFAAGSRNITSHSKNDSFGRKAFDELQLATGFVSRRFLYAAGEVTEEHVENATLHYVAGIKVGGGEGGKLNFYNDPYVKNTQRISIWKYIDILKRTVINY